MPQMIKHQRRRKTVEMERRLIRGNEKGTTAKLTFRLWGTASIRPYICNERLFRSLPNPYLAVEQDSSQLLEKSRSRSNSDFCGSAKKAIATAC